MTWVLVYLNLFIRRFWRTDWNGLGVKVEAQKPVNIVVDEIIFADAYRVDLFLDDRLVVELKALEKISGLHIRQTLTYVKLLEQPVGLLLNFGSERWSGGSQADHEQ